MTLIEPFRTCVSNFMCNLVTTGQPKLPVIGFDWLRLASIGHAADVPAAGAGALNGFRWQGQFEFIRID